MATPVRAFLVELKHRRVYRVAATYIAVRGEAYLLGSDPRRQALLEHVGITW